MHALVRYERICLCLDHQHLGFLLFSPTPEAAQVVKEFKTVTYATPPMWERNAEKKNQFLSLFIFSQGTKNT